MYAVVRGTKLFTLLPPADAYRLHMQQYSVARYQQHGPGDLRLVMQEPRQVSSLTRPRCTWLTAPFIHAHA